MKLDDIKKAYDILKEYKGSNPFIVHLKNSVFAWKTKTMNDFEAEYILLNHDKEPTVLNKMVKVADWYGETLKGTWDIEFVPNKLKITWYLGETSRFYHFYCIYRKSQEKAVELFAPKKGILTDLKILKMSICRFLLMMYLR